VLADAQRFWDREETTSGVIPEFSPGGTTSVQFCGEVSVLAFQDTGTSVLGASVARTTATRGTYENGWGVLTTTNAGTGSAPGWCFVHQAGKPRCTSWRVRHVRRDLAAPLHALIRGHFFAVTRSEKAGVYPCLFLLQ